jgi:citronellol/citronellal dehydrogenase
VSSAIFAPGLLAGRAALVTGGGTGLGKATARELLACGADVVIAGRRADVVRAAAEELGPRCGWVAGDIRDGAPAIVAAATERTGRLDVLVNNAGGQYFVPAEAIPAKGWRAVTRLNVGGTAAMAEAVAPGMRAQPRGGDIVNVTLSPHHGLAGMTHSSAARAAVEGLTRTWAEEWRGDGVAVVAVAAGHFDTEALDKYPDAVRAGAARSIPLGRLGRPEEHAWLVALLCSPLGRRFTGRTVTLDGGRDNWFGPWPPGALGQGDGTVPTQTRRPAPAP